MIQLLCVNGLIIYCMSHIDTIMSVIGNLCCGKCHRIIKFNEPVIIGELYTIAHQQCFYLLNEFEMDRGKFGYIANKYFK